MEGNDSADRDRASELAALRALSRQFPSVDSALAEIAKLSAELTLPRETIHVVSDVHGEYVKLRHVINNASGTLRPLVERLFAGRLSAPEIQDLLALIFYPHEMLEEREAEVRTPEALGAFCRKALPNLLELGRTLARRRTYAHLARILPAEYDALFREVLYDRTPYGDEYLDAVVDALVRNDRLIHAMRLLVRVLRNLAIDEIIVAGDCYDRGPRADRVVGYLERQPNVSFTWGNHDAAWIGAALGQEALIAHVLRVSLRYRRLSQLEEGYGITLQPLEHLARSVYGNDPAECFQPRGSGLRETLAMARMQKAAAILQFKLEGQTIRRNPEMELEHRCLLHRIDARAGTIEIDGRSWALRDASFPTVDPADPYALSAEERSCIDRIRQSFLASEQLWRHVRFLVENGSTYLTRDEHLIFHGCVPVDDDGRFLAYPIDGAPRRGRALFEALDRVVLRGLELRQQKDLDLFWYLWSGPLSPLFGKDRIATFERDLVADKAAHVENKNPYFRLIHEAPFCERVLAEFGVDPARGLIVNGHVPVKIDKGELPLKRSGKAITIDGAFSEAYGDHGYTLVIGCERTSLAMHHHFDSVEAAVRDGVDIIPTVTVIREHDPPRRVADAERGTALRAERELLEKLVDAYRSNALRGNR
jgi:fructose-1,6-bisphosphatase-3